MQYLNTMTELEINKLTEMLCSNDLEIRKLTVKILENEYNLDFTVYGLLDINIDKYKYSLDIKDGYGPIALKPKDLLDRYTKIDSELPYYILKTRLRLAKNLIKVIIEYNESKGR